MLEEALGNQGCNLVDQMRPDFVSDLLDLGLSILAHTACFPVNGVQPSASFSSTLSCALSLM